MPVTRLCLVLALTFFAESFAKTSFSKDDVITKFDSDYDLTSETKEVEGFEYTLHNLTFPAADEGGGDHERVKRLQNPLGPNNPIPLCIMTFNIRTFSFQAVGPGISAKNVIIARILNSADLIATQEIRSIADANCLLNLLNTVAGGAGIFNIAISNALPMAFAGQGYIFNAPGRQFPPSEHYVIFYRTAILAPIRHLQVPPIQLQGPPNPIIHQTRPPFVVEFRFRLLNGFGMVIHSFDFTVITIHTKPSLNPQAEINGLHDTLTAVINPPYCYSGNAIIMGDYNQGTNFVPAGFQSSLDQFPAYRQLRYAGGSTLAMNPQTHDRVYVHGYFTQTFLDVVGGMLSLTPAIPLVSVPLGHRAHVQRFWFNNMGVANPIVLGRRRATVSDHYPVQFQINAAVVPSDAWPIPQCGPLPPGRKRRATGNDCEDCLAMTNFTGVFPSSAVNSVDALKIIPNPIRRSDQEFLNFIDLEGAPFVFSDEERHADWCGMSGRACQDCRGVESSIPSINQCSDRIMCPILALKLLELLRVLQDCTGNNRTLIVHEAWEEPDSINPNPTNVESLHGQGLEAIISVSEAIQSLPLIERQDYSSDDSLLPELASLALCTGFNFVKMNSDNTLSVAVDECFDSQTRVPLCIKPSLENGDYVAPHEGPEYQQGDHISAVCLPGYRLEATSIRRRCLGVEGTDDWSGQDPECIREPQSSMDGTLGAVTAIDIVVILIAVSLFMLVAAGILCLKWQSMRRKKYLISKVQSGVGTMELSGSKSGKENVPEKEYTVEENVAALFENENTAEENVTVLFETENTAEEEVEAVYT